MIKVKVFIECLCYEEDRDYVIDTIMAGIPCGSAEKTSVDIDIVKDDGDDA